MQTRTKAAKCRRMKINRLTGWWTDRCDCQEVAGTEENMQGNQTDGLMTSEGNTETKHTGNTMMQVKLMWVWQENTGGKHESMKSCCMPSNMHWTQDILLKLSRGAVCQNANVWVSCSQLALERFLPAPSKMSEWVHVRIQQVDSQQASGCVDEGPYTQRARNWRTTNISGW